MGKRGESTWENWGKGQNLDEGRGESMLWRRWLSWGGEGGLTRGLELGFGLGFGYALILGFDFVHVDADPQKKMEG